MAHSLGRGVPPLSYIDKVISCAVCHGLDLDMILNCIQVKTIYRIDEQIYHWEADRIEITSASKKGCQICGVIDDFFETLLKYEEVKTKQRVEFRRPDGTRPWLCITFSWCGEASGEEDKKTVITCVTIPELCE